MTTLYSIALWGGIVFAPAALLLLSLNTRSQIHKQEEEISALLEGSAGAMKRLDGAVERALVALRSDEASSAEEAESNLAGRPQSGSAVATVEAQPFNEQKSLSTGETPRHTQRTERRRDPHELFLTVANVGSMRWRDTGTPCKHAMAYGDKFVVGGFFLPDKYQMWLVKARGCGEVGGETEHPDSLLPRKFASC